MCVCVYIYITHNKGTFFQNQLEDLFQFENLNRCSLYI